MNHNKFLSVLTGIVFFSIFGCQSARQTSETLGDAFYSEKHIDLAKWGRNSQCCSATGAKYAVASGGTFSSKAADEILKSGGNIVDAAVAVAFALAVERPHSAGLGGGAFMMVSMAGDRGGPQFLDFRETAPHQATKDMYLDEKKQVIAGKSTEGAMSIATPGFVAGLWEVHKQWGKLKWSQVLEPAIRLAKQGFPMYPSLRDVFTKKEKNLKHPYARSLVLKKNGKPYELGEVFRQPDLAISLEKIASEGRNAFYRGEIAKKITAFVKQQKGVLSEQDLDHYQMRSREPIYIRWNGHEIFSAPPPSAGGVLMAQMLNVLSKYDLPKESRETESYLHLLSQVMKRAYADRSKFIGDVDFSQTGYPFLMSEDYAEKIRAKVDREKNTPSKEMQPGEVPNYDRGTTQFSLIDDEGNAISGTMTINDSFGSGLAVPGTGIFLNNEMDDFSVKPGEQNLYGLTGGEANAIAPNKRPVSSMSPTIIKKDGKPVFVVGGAGGSRIISSVFQTILNYLVVYDRDVKKSVFAPRMHHQWLPDQLDLEDGYPQSMIDHLRKRGHTVTPWPFRANVQAVGRNRDGNFVATFDPRDEGGVVAN